jgi:hypothetical protein
LIPILDIIPLDIEKLIKWLWELRLAQVPVLHAFNHVDEADLNLVLQTSLCIVTMAVDDHVTDILVDL